MTRRAARRRDPRPIASWSPQNDPAAYLVSTGPEIAHGRRRAAASIKFKWKRISEEWRLFHARRIVAHVVPEPKYPDLMWRVKWPGGLSDIANLARAKDAALGFALRQIERRQNAAKSNEKDVQNQRAFSRPRPYVRLNRSGVSRVRQDGGAIQQARRRTRP